MGGGGAGGGGGGGRLWRIVRVSMMRQGGEWGGALLYVINPEQKTGAPLLIK